MRGKLNKSELLHPIEDRVRRRKRDRHDIIREILEMAESGTLKTRIMEKVGLSYSQLKFYLDDLKKADFISEESGVWKTTKKGVQVIEACRICNRLLKTAS